MITGQKGIENTYYISSRKLYNNGNYLRIILEQLITLLMFTFSLYDYLILYYRLLNDVSLDISFTEREEKMPLLSRRDASRV